MQYRTVSVGIAAFLVAGVVGWVASMPRPADIVSVDDGEQMLVAPADPAPSNATVDSAWLATTASATALPSEVLQAYAIAAITSKAAYPECGVTWNTIAAVGTVDGGVVAATAPDVAHSIATDLCADGEDLSTERGWTEAVSSHSATTGYSAAVRKQANVYAQQAARP